MEKRKGRSRPVRWTAERCIQALEAFLDREGRMPHMSEQGSKAGLASPKIFRKAVGCSYAEYGRRYEESPRWTAEKCMAAVDRFVQKNGRRPRLQSEASPSSGLPASDTFLRHTGMTMGAYLKSKYPELPAPRSLQLPVPRECGKVWTKDSIIAATDRFIERYGRYPKTGEYSMKYGLPTHNTFLAHFGITAGAYWRQRYPTLQQGWTADSILQAFERFVQEQGRLPQTKELRPENGLPASGTVTRHTGAVDYAEFCRTHFPEYVEPERWNRESCIQALERFLKEHGRRPAQEEHKQYEYLPSATTFTRHVGESEAQYCDRRHPELSRYWTADKAAEALEQFVERNGRPPSSAEFCSANQLPSYLCFARAVGMPAGAFLRERYPEYYAQTGKGQREDYALRML